MQYEVLMNKIFIKDLESITFSSEFRKLQNKTQLFYQTIGSRVRTRLTHSIEVRFIANKIAVNLNEKLQKSSKKMSLDLFLIDAIALAHDIGHTPFGHVGERVINDVFSREDCLGNLLNTSNDKKNKLFFKHNINSLRLLYNINNKISWQVLDGVICHTKIRKWDESICKDDPAKIILGNKLSKNDYLVNKIDPFLSFVGINKLLKEQDYYNSKEVPSLSLEGQIVSIADEVAQRISDINDGIQSRYYNKIKEILLMDIDKETDNDRILIEDKIKTAFIDDIVNNSYNNIVNCQAEYSSSLRATVYRKKLISFSNTYKSVNDDLEKFILCHIAQSEEIRKSDSRSRFVIRQIFKAFYNAITLLPDEIIYNYFNIIKNFNLPKFDSNFSQEFKAKYNYDKIREICKTIKKDEWQIKNYQLKEKNVFDFGVINAFLNLLRDNDKYNDGFNNFDYMLYIYISKIGFYIASMTDNEASYIYNEIYGHNI